MEKIMISGGAGFVGASLALYFKQKYPSYEITALDNLKRRGSELNIPRLKNAAIEFIHCDVRSKEDFEGLPACTTFIEASAEPSVMAGIKSPIDYLIHTNLNGTINCLNFSLRNNSKFIFLSTSRVYPINQIEKINIDEKDNRFEIAGEQKIKGISANGINEDFSLEGYRSFYGTSKLSSELFIAEYHQYYHLKTVINRCGILTGAWQMGKIDQGVAVLWMAKHFWKQPLSYTGFGGKGKQVRDMLHIADLFRLVDYQIHNMDSVNGETYNVGGGSHLSISLKEMTAICEKFTGNKIEIDSVPETHSADIKTYVSDYSKIAAKTGWKPEKTIENIFSDIYLWIKGNEKQLENILK